MLAPRVQGSVCVLFYCEHVERGLHVTDVQYILVEGMSEKSSKFHEAGWM